MFFIFSLLCSFLFLTTVGASDCMEFTMDGCHPPEGSLINDPIAVETEDYCQNTYCAVAFKSECNYYVFDTQAKMCQLYRNDMIEYIKTCTRVGGPKGKLIEDCLSSVNPCKTFLDGDCEYDGDVLLDLDFVESLEDCQVLCESTQGCLYFVHDKLDSLNCKLYSTTGRKCMSTRGPIKPPKENCFDFSSTTGGEPTTEAPTTEDPTTEDLTTESTESTSDSIN